MITKPRKNDRFGGNREKAIQRDNERCVNCGMTRGEHKDRFGKDFDVDHIDGYGSRVKKDTRNNSLSNLRTLCRPCHGEIGKKARKGSELYRELGDNLVPRNLVEIRDAHYDALKAKVKPPQTIVLLVNQAVQEYLERHYKEHK